LIIIRVGDTTTEIILMKSLKLAAMLLMLTPASYHCRWWRQSKDCNGRQKGRSPL